MNPALLPSLSVSTALAFLSLGGACYEFLVIDPAWVTRPDLVQPARGGISRKRFWMPAHGVFELTLIVALVLAWGQPDLRNAVGAALAAHVTMRVWSFADLIPKAMAIERGEPTALSARAIRSWVVRSRCRILFDLTTVAALVTALTQALRLHFVR